MTEFSRRKVLRGMLNGGAVGVALPLLDCFLNSNGTALASGEKLPIRFGTWFWGCGVNASIFVPTKVGRDFEFPEESESLTPHRDRINVLSNGNAFRDNSPNICHFTGWAVSRTGIAPQTQNVLATETYDIKIANQISNTRRFKSLNATAAGDARISYSYEDPQTPVPAEYSPILFYTRLFGPDFPDPNAKEFKPDPRIMVRKSVLSPVMEELSALQQKVGAEDRKRLEQYFTGLRQIEQQFSQQLMKPEPLAACRLGTAPASDIKMAVDTGLVAERHNLLSDLMAMAVACDQTRVINMGYAAALSNTTKVGYEKPHHTATHEEPRDEKLGYQPMSSWFTRRAMESLAYFISAFADIKEGDGTLLDNMFIVADTDHGYARLHSLDGVPMLTAGRAGGKFKTGLHIDLKGTSVARVGYTAMRVFGVEIDQFGDRSNTTSDAVADILV